MYNIAVFILILMFSGCTIHMSPQQVDKKVAAELEMKQSEQGGHKPWPQDEKYYWYARYFHTMASNPGIQRILKPEAVFGIVKCTMEIYERDHSWRWFLENLANVQVLTAVNAKYVYDVTKLCSTQQKERDGERTLRLT